MRRTAPVRYTPVCGVVVGIRVVGIRVVDDCAQHDARPWLRFVRCRYFLNARVDLNINFLPWKSIMHLYGRGRGGFVDPQAHKRAQKYKRVCMWPCCRAACSLNMYFFPVRYWARCRVMAAAAPTRTHGAHLLRPNFKLHAETHA